jgi:uncharacterized membrane protein
MTTTSTTILDTTVYGTPSGNYDGSSQDWISDAVKAANYYRGYGSIQTVLFSVTGFEGIIHLDATLDSDPGSAAWFETFVYGDGSSIPLTDYHPESIQGNFTWMRVRVVGFSGGTINAVTITY